MPRMMRRRVVPVSVASGNLAFLPRSAAAVVKNSVFFYDLTITFTVASQVLGDTVRIRSDAHFLCTMTMFDSTASNAGGAGSLNGGNLVQLQDLGGQRLLSDNPVPMNCIFGTGQRPFPWPYTHIFRASAGIVVTLTNGTVAANVVRMVFAGYKVPVGLVRELDLAAV